MNCIAVDDEPLALNLLADNISKIPFLNLLAVCDDAFSANKVLQESQVDLVFIDIQMPGVTGLQFIESLVKKPMVILVTAYKQYALDGFALDVVDYLMKPVSMERFMKACNKAKDFYELRHQQGLPGEKAPEYMFLNVGYSLLKIVFDDVLYIEGLKDYVQVHLKSTPKPAVARISFKNLEGQLPVNFIRIHKSFIVNSGHLTSVKKNAVFIGEQELPLGDTYRAAIEELISSNRF